MTKDSEPIMPGIKPVLEILARRPALIARVYCKKSFSGKHAQQLAELCRAGAKPLEYVEESFLNTLCASQGRSKTTHQGVVAILRQLAAPALGVLLDQAGTAPLPLVLALDEIQDTGNLGAICRTAWAMGCAGLILPKHNSAQINGAAARASAGSLAMLPICQVTNLARALDDAEERGFAIYGAGCDTDKRQNAFETDWRLPAVLVLGNEQKGIRPGVAKRCQTLLCIPLARGFDSLNVAQAGAMLIALCASKLS